MKSLLAMGLATVIGHPSVPAEVISDLADVRTAAATGDTMWPGFSTAPFGFVLVHPDGETLLCDDRIPEGFVPAAPIADLDCAVAHGPPSWRKPFLLAAMPVFGPGEVIVMGAPADSKSTRAAWKRTVLHEHFHQWQGQLPEVYARIAALDLADGDATGMWMIQFPFPYADPAVGAAYRIAADKLASALSAPDDELRVATSEYLAARRAFADASGERNWRYYDFQLWKEGVARWTEVAVARAAGGPWRDDADEYWVSQLDNLRSASLADIGRVSVYAYGAAEAALLERIDPDWRGCYRVVLGLTQCWKSLQLVTPD